MNIQVYLYVHLLKGILVASKFWQLKKNAMWNFLYGYKSSVSLGKCQREKLLDHIVRVCLALKEAAKLPSKVPK